MYVGEVNKKKFIFSKQYFGYVQTYIQILSLDLQSLPRSPGALTTTGHIVDQRAVCLLYMRENVGISSHSL